MASPRRADVAGIAPGARGGAPWLTASLEWGMSRAGRLVSGHSTWRGGVDPRVDFQALRLRAELLLARGTELQAALPWLAVRAEGEAGTQRWSGVGDLTLGLRQDLGRWMTEAPAWVPRVGLGLGLELPTGRVDDRTVDTARQLVAEGGDVEFTSYALRAGLGQGVLQVTGAADLSWRIGARGGLRLGLSGRVPVTHAQGETRRGAALALDLTGSARLLGERVVPFAGLAWRREAGDRYAATAADEATGAQASRALLAFVGARLGLGRGVALTASAELPLRWDVDGVRLVESFGVMVALSYTHGAGARAGASAGSRAGAPPVHLPVSSSRGTR